LEIFEKIPANDIFIIIFTDRGAGNRLRKSFNFDPFEPEADNAAVGSAVPETYGKYVVCRKTSPRSGSPRFHNKQKEKLSWLPK
jgi:hypothetical protein